MSGAILPVLSYGAGAAPPGDCDLEFTAALKSDFTGVDSDGTQGTVLATSPEWDTLVGSNDYVLVTVGAGFFMVAIAGTHAQDDFTSITVEQWSQTFLTASAFFSENGGFWQWIWFTNTDSFQIGSDYCITFE